MPLNPNRPLLHLITSGATSELTTSSSDEYKQLLKLTEAAVAAEIHLVQIREKNLTTRVLFELATDATEITRGAQTQLLINDRADVAASVGAGGVHLTTQSLPVSVVRASFGAAFVIGVSTHSIEEALAAKEGGADFIVFGPVFNTLSKTLYGNPMGIDALATVVSQVAPLPVLALGGVNLDNAGKCGNVGAAGVAAISMFGEPARLVDIAREVRARFRP